MSDLHTGGEVEAYCGSCKDMRWHVIVAMVGDSPVKVECVSCHKQHGYRTGPALAKGSGAAPKKKAAKTSAKAEPVFDMNALNARAHEARAYAPAQTFQVGDILRHPTFGLGLVQAVPAPQKMDVRFPSGPRLLVHGRT
jgi:hypothetical protein